jgi:hypothetical protein
MTEKSDRCRAEYQPSDWHSQKRCTNRAVTEAGYCRVHDPEHQAKRAAKRPPSKFERWREARDELTQLIDSVPDEALRDQIRDALRRTLALY